MNSSMIISFGSLLLLSLICIATAKKERIKIIINPNKIIFDDKFNKKSLQANFIKTKIKSSIKNEFYNVNIEKIEIIKNENMINEISYVSYQDLLGIDKIQNFDEIRVLNQKKILTISLN